jgi:hypothetical protein
LASADDFNQRLELERADDLAGLVQIAQRLLEFLAPPTDSWAGGIELVPPPRGNNGTEKSERSDQSGTRPSAVVNPVQRDNIRLDG